MYQIPNFAVTTGTSGRGFEGYPGMFGGMSSTQNQYMNFPSLTSDYLRSGVQMSSSGMDGMGGGGGSYYPLPMDTQMQYPPGVVPPQGSPVSPSTNPSFTNVNPGIGAKGNLGRAGVTVPTLDPGFTQMMDEYLRSQLGQGVAPFNLSAFLPSTGGFTGPGQLTAPENPILQQLQQFYETGTGGPLPGVLPMWQSEMKAMQIPIQEQLANIKEQFGSRGALGSSEMAQALETFGAQTAADQEALLGQLTLQALPQEAAFGAGLQNMDQASIDRLVQEFIRTSPQYNPLLQGELGFATTFPPVAGKGPGFMSAFSQALGSSLGTFGLSGGTQGTPLTFGIGG